MSCLGLGEEVRGRETEPQTMSRRERETGRETDRKRLHNPSAMMRGAVAMEESPVFRKERPTNKEFRGTHDRSVRENLSANSRPIRLQ